MSTKLKLLLIFIAALIVSGLVYLFVFDHTTSAPQSSDAKNQDDVLTNQTAKPDTQPTPTFNKTAYSVDDPASIWVVANKQRPLNPKTYAPTDLVSVGGGQQLRSEAANALKQMIAAASKEGLTISPLSGYRSYDKQVAVYGNEVKTNGQAVADTQSARPGYSEHQTGFSIDVGGGGCGIEDCFGNTAEGKWVAANSHNYGFIVRYVPGKESITGYRAEPWHIRYVGTNLSNEMKNKNIATLEEFFGLPAAPSY